MADGLEATLRVELVGVAESGLLLLAVALGDGVDSVDAGELVHAVGDDLSVLNVETLDLREGAGVGAVISDELGDDGEGLAGVDGEALAVEGGVTLAVRVEVASVGVAEA